MSSKIATYGSVTRHLELNYSNLIQNAKILYRHFLGLGKTFFDGLVTLEMVPANLLNKSWPMIEILEKAPLFERRLNGYSQSSFP